MVTLPTVLTLCLLAAGDEAAPKALTEAAMEPLEWRPLGPVNMGGRVLDLAVHPQKKRIFYVAAATGGLFKTSNGGVTFQAVFEHGGSSSVGDVAIAPSDPEVVWIGTGEANPRNSVSWGDGVYLSQDGGKSWQHRGLKETRHIGRIAVDPRDASTAFVAALGSTWGPNEERGLYRTRDGGESWDRVLYIDQDTGCVDVLLDPSDPNIIFAATYQRRRDEFDSNDPAVRTGPGSGIWRSLDGGDSFERLTHGLPTVDMGRIGLEMFGADRRIIYAVIETAKTGERGAPPRSEDRVALGIKGVDHDDGFLVTSVSQGESAAQAGLEKDDIIVHVADSEIDGRASLMKVMKAFRPGDAAEITFLRGEERQTERLTFLGKLFRSQAKSFAGSQSGQIADAQDDQGEEGFESGGLFRSEDRGTTWERINSINPRPYYYSQIRVDPTDETYVFVLGISLHGSDTAGKTFEMKVSNNVHPDHHAMWIDPQDPEHMLLGNDGGLYVTFDRATTWDHIDMLPIAQFYNVAVDMRQPYRVFGGLQDNGSWAGPSSTRTGGGATVADWMTIGGGDGFHCAVDPSNPDIVYSESQGGVISRLDLSTGETAMVSRPQARDNRIRYNWNTPFLLSPHNSSILYFAGNQVMRSIDRGDTHEIISEEISRTDRGSATALAESPRLSGLLYVGTDDGALWVSRDSGNKWTDLAGNLPDLGKPLYVSDIEPSHHQDGRVYLTLDGHRSDDYAPHAFVSDDYGATWKSISDGLGEVSVRTIVEDPGNEQLLFVGTETACHVSLDGGAYWTLFTSKLPTVPVHDLVIHPRDTDLVAATHGRGIWVAEIAPLRELTAEKLAAGPHLFEVEPVHLWHQLPSASLTGARHFTARNPRRGAQIFYYLPQALEETVTLTIRSAVGEEIRTLEGKGDAGIQVVNWDLRQGRQSQGGGGRGGQGGGRRGAAEPGDYSVTLKLGEESQTRRIRILPDPLAPNIRTR